MIEGVRGHDPVHVVEVDFIAPDTRIKLEIAVHDAVQSQEGSSVGDGEIVARDKVEYTVRVRVFQVQSARRVAAEVQSSQQRVIRGQFLLISCVSARYGAELALLDQSEAEIGFEAEAVGSLVS